MDLFDKDGKPVAVPDEHVGAALASGSYGLPQGARIPVKLASGRIGTVTQDNLGRHLANGGQVISADAYQAHKEQQEYGDDLGHEAAAVGLGAANSLTLGLSNVAASKLGQGARDYVRKTKENNPGLYGTGEVGGAIVPAAVAALSGGAAAPIEGGILAATEAAEAAEGLGLAGRAGTAALEAGEGIQGARTAASATSHLASTAANAIKAPIKLLGAPLEATNEVGNLVQKGIAKVVGDQATGLAGKIAQKGAQLAGRGAVENAIMAGGNEIGEEALGDPELNGQKILASIGHGALLGLGIGGAIGAAGELGSAALGRVATHLSGEAEEQVIRAVSPKGKAVLRAEDIPGGARGVARTALDDGLMKDAPNLETLAERTGQKVTESGESITNRLAGLDEGGAEGPKLGNVFKELNEKTLPELEKYSALGGGAAKVVRELQDNLAGIVGIPTREATIAEAAQRVAQTTERSNPAFADILKKETESALLERESALQNARFTFEQAHEARIKIDGSIKSFGTMPGVESPTQAALKDVRFAVEREIESAGDIAAKKAGGSFLDEYKADKLRFRQYRWLDEQAKKELASRVQRRVASPSDYGAGALGALVGGGEGHGLMGGLTGLAAGVAHHYIRERGNAVAAMALDKLSALGAVKRASEAVDREVDRGVARALGHTDRVAPRIKTVGGSYADKSEAVIKAASNPDAHADGVATAIGPLEAHAPQVANSFQRAALKSTAYLAKALPQGPVTGPHQRQADVSDVDKEKWESLYDVVHDPTAALQHIADGSLTTDQVDAIKATHPDLYAETQQKLVGELAHHRGDLSMQQLVGIGTFLGQPADVVASPLFLNFIQASYGKQPTKGGGASHAAAPKRKLDMVDPYKLKGV